MMLQVINSIQDFIEQGGPVLWVIFAACLLLWLLILERALFVRVVWPRRARRLVALRNGSLGYDGDPAGCPEELMHA